MQPLSRPTLHQYLEMRNLQRKKENYLIDQEKYDIVPVSLCEADKLDKVVLDILDYIKQLLGPGPLYHKFQIMMQHLHKLYRREISEFHSNTVAIKVREEQRYMEEIKKANRELDTYFKESEKAAKEAEQRLKALQNQNKYLRLPGKQEPKKETKETIEVGKPEITTKTEDAATVIERIRKRRQADLPSMKSVSSASPFPNSPERKGLTTERSMAVVEKKDEGSGMNLTFRGSI